MEDAWLPNALPWDLDLRCVSIVKEHCQEFLIRCRSRHLRGGGIETIKVLWDAVVVRCELLS